MKKRLICMLLAVVVVFSLMATSALALSTDVRFLVKYKVTGDSVNFRTGPYTTSASYGLMYRGELFYRYEDDVAQNGFYQGLNGPETALYRAYGESKEGYISAQYVQKVN